MLLQLNRRLFKGYDTIWKLGCLFNITMACYDWRQVCLYCKKWHYLSLFLLLFLCFSITGNAQQRPDTHDIKHYGVTADSTNARRDTAAAKKKRNIFHMLLKAVSKKHPDTAFTPIMPKLATKSEVPYLPYKGKIIRLIDIRKFGFEKTFTDTSRGSKYFGTRILNNLHRDTRTWQIRNNLFIQENTPLNVYLLAENERYLRSLDYIQDARILVKPVPGTDSVDLLVVTKDLFSITGSIGSFTTNKIKLKVGEENLFGTGQKLEVTGLYEKDRSPNVAGAVLYGINSINHSFIDATLTVSQFNLNLGR